MAKLKPKYSRVAQLKTAEQFDEYLKKVGANLPFNANREYSDYSGLKSNFKLKSGKTIGNRFCILPMEGWDGTTDGRPTEYTKRRWENFAISRAKLLWGCEAVAVRAEGRANPNQLMINTSTHDEFKKLHEFLISKHTERYGQHDDLVIGLQLTHSGRFAKPMKDKPTPKILYPHPILNDKLGLKNDYPLISDEDIDRLVDEFVAASVMARQAGFDFVDIKHCHGYLGHEFLSAYDREGKYGGSFENRTRFLRSIVEGIRSEAPGLEIGVRASAFDMIPFKKGVDETGIPWWDSGNPYAYAFGGQSDGKSFDYEEIFQFMTLLEKLDIQLVCITAGSPYYNPHIQRPALFPPSDGYLPPEDPLVGVARQIHLTHEIKKAFPDQAIVGSAYSYLQEWLPQVGLEVVEQGMADFIGLGRMVLSYPDMPEDILRGKVLQRGKICRTFSDCTTAPRNNLVSGCYPLDSYYKSLPEAAVLKATKETLS